jgi:hypothetical protein
LQAFGALLDLYSGIGYSRGARPAQWRMYEAVAAVDFHQSSPADGMW